MIKFLLLANKLGQVRIAQYYTDIPPKERHTLESELIRKCLSRDINKCQILIHQNYKIIYRRYVSLYFIIAVDSEEENEYIYYSFIQLLVETLNKYFKKVCELDIIMNLEKTHYIIEEMVMNGEILEASKQDIVGPVIALDQALNKRVN